MQRDMVVCLDYTNKHRNIKMHKHKKGNFLGILPCALAPLPYFASRGNA